MKSEDMILKAAIVHILDSSVGIPVLSDQSMEVGPDFSDFLKAHIEKITESDDVKHCTFAEGSEVKELLQNCTPDNFVETSKQLAERLYDIMNANIDIPAADVAMTVFGCKGKDYLAFLKMNYKTSYTHQTRETDGGNSNEIILQRALLPGQGQRLSEAFVLDLSDGSLLLFLRALPRMPRPALPEIQARYRHPRRRSGCQKILRRRGCTEKDGNQRHYL